MLRTTIGILKLVAAHICLALRMLHDELLDNGNEKDDSNAAMEIDMVTELRVPFEVSDCPDESENDPYKEYFTQGELYLVGTCHVGYSTAEVVHETISRVRPDVVLVELDTQRQSILDASVFADFTDRHLPAFSYARDVRTAGETARTIPNCQVVLGDRKFTTTLKRCMMALVRSASLLHILAGFGVLLFGLLIAPLAGLFVESAGGGKLYMTKNGIEEQRKKFREFCPALAEALIDERDLFMTHMLHKVFEMQSRAKFSGDAEPVRVVAVVGAMHVPGIASLFGKPVSREVLEELCQ